MANTDQVICFTCCACDSELKIQRLQPGLLYTVCVECGHRLVVQPDLSCRSLTEEDFKRMSGVQWRVLTNIWLQIKGDRHGPSLGFDRQAPRAPLPDDFLEWRCQGGELLQSRLLGRFQRKCRRYGQAAQPLFGPDSCIV